MKYKDTGSWALVSLQLLIQYRVVICNGILLCLKKYSEKSLVKIIPTKMSSKSFSIFVHTLRKITVINRKITYKNPI